jgi:hypothetical protein
MKRGKNFTFTILSLIKEGLNPAQISRQLGLSKQALNPYITTLKELGCIKKLGYGTWAYLRDFNQKEVKTSAVIGHIGGGGSLTQDHVRGHGFLFKIKVKPNIRGWDNREAVFNKIGIKFKDYLVGGIKRGQIIDYKGYKVGITDGSVILNLPESFIAERATRCKRDAIYRAIQLIKGIEGLLGVDLMINRQYMFKVSRQHYALIKNALAQQYDSEDNKLHVYAGQGLWLLIDNSFNLHELETVHPNSADRDNLVVQNFFNSLKDNPTTPKEILLNLNESQENIKRLSAQGLQMTQVLEQINTNIIKLMGHTFRDGS